MRTGKGLASSSKLACEGATSMVEKALLLIVMMRVFSGSVDLVAAFLMYKFNDLEKAFYINTLLALVGPTVLIITTGIALFGLAEKVSVIRMVCLFGGIILILYSLNAE